MLNTSEAQGGATIMHCDCDFAIGISKKPIFQRKTKHIKIKYHFVRQLRITVKSS